MQRAYILTLMLSIVMVSGLLLVNIGFGEVFAEKGGNKKAKGDPQGCDNGKGKDAAQNPNCGNGCIDEMWFLDNDGDLYGGVLGQISCGSPGPGWTTVGGDCDDDNNTINPGAGNC